jgi:hypothetical protein
MMLLLLNQIVFQGDLVVDTSLVGTVMNGLSHFHQVANKAHFGVCLVRGIGGNLSESCRENFAKEVFIFAASLGQKDLIYILSSGIQLDRRAAARPSPSTRCQLRR